MGYKTKEQNATYQKMWREKNKDKWNEIRKKSDSRPERKEYIKKWQKESPKFKEIRKRFQKSDKSKEYQKEWEKNNHDKVLAKGKRFYYSLKGTVNFLKKHDRYKFGIENNNITEELINMVNNRDKVCKYCGGELIPRKEYDHINPWEHFSKDNIALCCSSCNQSKSNADLLQWMKFKRYKITEDIINLYNKAYN